MEIDRKKVFLSHHSSKVELAVHLSRYLEKTVLLHGMRQEIIPTGADWPNEIENAIASCSAFILLFCAKADSSQQVKRELALADKYKKPVFWVKIENVEPNNLGYFLTATQWLNWLDNRRRYFGATRVKGHLFY
ncbi:MAG: toll/interleukin-1 receptor domain-containing protein [Thomasclavelia sp.]